MKCDDMKTYVSKGKVTCTANMLDGINLINTMSYAIL